MKAGSCVIGVRRAAASDSGCGSSVIISINLFLKVKYHSNSLVLKINLQIIQISHQLAIQISCANEDTSQVLLLVNFGSIRTLCQSMAVLQCSFKKTVDGQTLKTRNSHCDYAALSADLLIC